MKITERSDLHADGRAFLGTSTRFPTGTAARHLGFCARLSARTHRVAARPAMCERAFVHAKSIPCIAPISHRAMSVTNAFAAHHTHLTFAPGIRIDFAVTHAAKAVAPSAAFAPAPAAPIGSPPRPVRNIAFLQVTQPSSGDTDARRAFSDFSSTAHSRIEHAQRESLSIERHVRSTLRRTEWKRVETIVRRAQAVVVPQSLPTPERARPAEQRKHAEATARQPVSPPVARIPDTDVARLTDRVVQQINRRILAERERRGRI